MVAHSLRMATGNVCRRIPLRVTNSNVSGWYICICSAPKVLKRSCEEVIYLLFISLDVSFAEGGHIGAQVIEPNLTGIAFVLAATGKKQHIGFDALSIENAGGQAKNGMQVALLHQVAADALTIAVSKQNVVWQNNCRTSAAVLIQATVDVLQEVQLFVAGGESKVVTGSTFSSFLGAEGRICQNDIIL